MKNTLLMTTALVAVFGATDVRAAKNIDASYYTTPAPEGSWVYSEQTEHNEQIIKSIHTSDIADLTDDEVTISGVYAQTEFTDNNGTALGMSIGNTQTEGYAHTKELTLDGSSGKYTRLDIDDRNEDKSTALDLLNISEGGEVNVINSDGIHADGNINITGGVVNLNGSELIAEDKFAKLKVSGGEINISGDENTFNGIGSEISDDNVVDGYNEHAWDSVDVTGGKINVNSGKAGDLEFNENIPDVGNYLVGTEVNISGGELNIAENSGITTVKGYKDNSNENTTYLAKANINLTDDGVINLSGTLTSNVMGTGTGEGNGTLNINNSNAVVNGEVNDVNLNINANSTLSTLFTENEKEYTNLTSLNVNEGNTFTVDSELGVINAIKVAKGASLNVKGTDLYTFEKNALTDDIVINGTLSATDSTIQAGNDAYVAEKNSNILLDGATVNLTDTDLEAVGNINIKNTSLTSNSSGTGENGYGIWADGDISIEGGNLKLTQSYLNADGDISVDGGNHTLVDSAMDSYNGDIAINAGTVNMNGQSIDAWNGSIEMTGGELNMNNSSNTEDQDVTLWAAKGITISGGTINMNADEASIDTLYDLLGENGEVLPKPEKAGDITITGKNTVVNVNSSTAEISSEGTISIANGAQVNITEKGVLSSYSSFEIVDDDLDLGKKSTLSLTDTGTINLSGKLNSHIDGNGLVNIKTSSALIDGDINGSNITFEADHALSKAISGTIGELSSLNVKKGTLTFDKKVANIGNLNIDGGLDIGLNNVTVSGDAIFNSGSKLSLEIADADKYGSLSADSITAKDGSKLALNVTKQMAIDEEISGLKLLDAPTIDNKFTNELSNARYEVSNDKGTYTIKYVASASDVVADAGGSSNNAGTAEAWDAIISAPAVSETAKAVANVLNELSKAATTSEGKKAYVDALTAIAPDAAPSVQQTQSETANQVFGAVGSRLSGGSVSQSGGGRGVSSNSGGRGMGGAHGGRGGHGGKGGHGRSHGGRGMSSGDTMYQQTAVWMQGLFNKAELEDTSKSKGFDSETSGVALGIENFINEDVKVGIGYAYNHTDIDGFMRSTDVDTHTAIAYGEYKPSNWFINAVATYGWSDYEENKNVAGSTVKAKYDAESFGLQAMTGYEFGANGYSLTPETGLRYVHIKQDGYKDTADQKVSGGQSDILTGVIGAKLSKNWELDNGMNLRPEIRVAATYDLVNDDAGSVVTLANGSAYNVSGEALDEFGMEFGAGLTAEVNDNIELFLGYEGKFKKDYQDHSGLINAKYKF
ncbi:MAG: autotransporter domain-containing protein [Alphaproteobacteria bacterium]|nr:autotransporter domain-containing protein [Alphaproteobacteria bacterium]